MERFFHFIIFIILHQSGSSCKVNIVNLQALQIPKVLFSKGIWRMP